MNTEVAEIERLLAQAETRRWYAPRWSWMDADTAYEAAHRLDRHKGIESHVSSLLPRCALGLAAAWNALGRFSDALPLLLLAADRFHALGHDAHLALCRSEEALARGALTDFDSAWSAANAAFSLLERHDDHLVRAGCERVAGLLHLMQNRYSEAAALLARAAKGFMAAGRAGEAAITRCELAESQRFLDPQLALESLQRAREISVPENSPVHTARCDHVLALIYDELNQYRESLALYQCACNTFQREGLVFLAARCTMDQGISHYRLNHYDKALEALQRARSSFATLGLGGHTASCDLNVAVVYYDLNRYAEALTIYARVAEDAITQGRLLRTARCYTNMGLCYERLGRYDRALDLHDRARQAFLDAEDPVNAAHCQENLAAAYRALGRHRDAMVNYQAAYATFNQRGLASYAASCNVQMANLFLALRQPEQARQGLEDARRLYAERSMAVHEALCQRYLAEVYQALQQPEPAGVALGRAREVLTRYNLIVELAVCDLVEGEIAVETGHLERAEALFDKAREILNPGFPDQALRVEVGMASCALAFGDQRAALEHYTRAAALISRGRDTLPTERLRSAFFVEREHIFQKAIELALKVGAVEWALTLVEASKARALLIENQPLRLHAYQNADPYVSQLVARAAALRAQLRHLRQQLRLGEAYDEPLQPEVTRGGQARALGELVELSQVYDSIVEQLRLAVPRAPFVSPPDFSIQAFRQVAATAFEPGWLCVEYFLSDDQLVLFTLDACRLRAFVVPLSADDRRLVEQCVSSESDRRELIYRGTIRGFPVPDDRGRRYRERLGQLLLPPALFRDRDVNLLIISPHGLLHGLPFHALLVDTNMTLLERTAVLYAPTLHVLQTLCAAPRHDLTRSKSLIYGLDRFEESGRALPATIQEVAGITAALGGAPHVLQGADATAARLKAMSASAQLATYDVLHFATHAVADPVVPLLSRVLLADDDLTVTDILELKLAARLVTLAACESAAGEVHPGDEMMTLARAFFYAGAQTVVAGLWQVEDNVTSLLMQRFYQQLRAGVSIPEALRHAQLTLCQEGYSPYQWAPFVAIGRP